jgi:hypothetical protein
MVKKQHESDVQVVFEDAGGHPNSAFPHSLLVCSHLAVLQLQIRALVSSTSYTQPCAEWRTFVHS